MPKVTLTFPPNLSVDAEKLQRIGLTVKAIVAEAVSTKKRKLTLDDIDWVPYQAPPGSLVGTGIELETIGFPDRVKKLNRVQKKLKRDILGIPEFEIFGMSADEPLLWVKYVNPRGKHI